VFVKEVPLKGAAAPEAGAGVGDDGVGAKGAVAGAV
jgi:hypothetical protein